MPPQSVPVLRQPYPPNYFPYGGHYFHPYYMPPIPQYLSHNGFPQQPSTGNVYLTPAPAPGVKTSLPQLKPGTNAGNPAHIGLSFGGSFIAPPPVGYSPGSAVTSGSSTGIEDLSSSQMKENHVYTTGQLVGFVSFFLKYSPLLYHQLISCSILKFNFPFEAISSMEWIIPYTWRFYVS